MKRFIVIGCYLISFILLNSCQYYPVDAKCYYKSPFLYIENNNVYDWTDVLIKIKINGSATIKRTCIYNLKTLVAGRDTVINIDDLINKETKPNFTSFIRSQTKVHVVIVSFQGKYSNTINIK